MQKFLSRVFRYRVLVRKVMQLSASVISFVRGNEKKKKKKKNKQQLSLQVSVDLKNSWSKMKRRFTMWSLSRAFEGGSFQLDRIVARENILD